MYFLLSSILIMGVDVDVGVHVDVAEDGEGEEDLETDI